MKRLSIIIFMLLSIPISKIRSQDGIAPKIASTVKEKQPEIVFQSNSYTFEEKEGTVVKHLYQFENTGSEALQISEVKTSCDCVKAIAKAKTIQPGSKSEIEVTFNTINEVGIHQVTITVFSNAKNQENIDLTFNGKVIK